VSSGTWRFAFLNSFLEPSPTHRSSSLLEVQFGTHGIKVNLHKACQQHVLIRYVALRRREGNRESKLTEGMPPAVSTIHKNFTFSSSVGMTADIVCRLMLCRRLVCWGDRRICLW
jgi:hypothetical protein